MTGADRETWLRTVVMRISGNSTDGTRLDEDLEKAVGLDSLGRLEVLAEIEDQFDFFFEDNELVEAVTLSQILGAIDDKLKDQARVDA